MASSAGMPLAMHHEEDRSVFLLSDSDEDATPPPFELPATRYDPHEHERAVLQKTKEAAANVPLHPIPDMQPAFAESLVEATNNGAAQKPKLKFGDAKQRRNHLLDGAKDDPLHGALWRLRPGQNYHELWKLLSQISFGVYLLLNGLANSNDQVVSILQGHIDEVDEFLETTMEDVNVAIEDVKERIDFLKLPMANIATFEKMLEDRNFRLQIVTGNEKIEHIIARTTHALEAYLQDIDEGLKVVKVFAMYLGEQKDGEWRQERPDVLDVFDAMKGNAEGWWKALMDLQETTASLDSLLINLGQMVAEMDQRAGEVSRRTRFSVAPFSDPSDSTHSRNSSVRSPPSDSRLGKTPSQNSHNSHHSHQSRQSRNSHRSSSSGGSFPLFHTQSLERQSSEPRSAQRVEPMERLEEHSTLEVADQQTQQPDAPAEDEGLYILQPRTYTPQPPAPLPSPRIVKSPSSPRSARTSNHTSPRVSHDPRDSIPRENLARDSNPLSQQSSLRQRVSERGGTTPDRIHVPGRPDSSRVHYKSPRTSNQGPDSAYGSDAEGRAPVSRPRLEVGFSSPPAMRITSQNPSPRSEQQFFRPVLASPHSPLQQRPWTAGGPAAQSHHSPNPHRATHQGHLRNQPSNMGMSMLSSVTNAPNDHRPTTSHTTRTTQTQKTVKKKRSAFGWLKKAFTLDEEERAQFEARKNQENHNRYYEERNPKFLDGKRIDPNRRMTEYSRRH